MKKRIIIVLAMCVLAGQLITGAQTKDRERCHQDGTKEKPSFEELSQRKAERMAMDLALDDATAKEFIELYKDVKFIIYNPKDSEIVDEAKDKEYYSWSHK
jgi:hypothetical protein